MHYDPVKNSKRCVQNILMTQSISYFVIQLNAWHVNKNKTARLKFCLRPPQSPAHLPVYIDEGCNFIYEIIDRWKIFPTSEMLTVSLAKGLSRILRSKIMNALSIIKKIDVALLLPLLKFCFC